MHPSTATAVTPMHDRGSTTPLGILLEASDKVAAGGLPLDSLSTLLLALAKVAGGVAATLLMTTDEVRAFYGADHSNVPEILVCDGVELVQSGDVAEIIRDWEGNSDPVLLESGGLLVLPRHGGGAAVRFPATGVGSDPEAVHVMQVLLNMAHGLIRTTQRATDLEARASELKETRRRLREQTVLLGELAVIDQLTGLHNRRFFDRRLAYEVDRFLRYNHSMSLLIFDIDFFKKVNDTYGHPGGDAVLKGICVAATSAVRRVDLLARVGGEEFALLMPDTEAEGALITTNRLFERVREMVVPFAEHLIQVTISAGVATIGPGWQGDSSSLYRTADQALYRAKEGGRDQFIHTTLPRQEG